jgi:hypothetical protein
MKHQILPLAILSIIMFIPVENARGQDNSGCYIDQSNKQRIDLSKICNKQTRKPATKASLPTRRQVQHNRTTAVPENRPSYQTQPNADGSISEGMANESGGPPTAIRPTATH